MAAARLPGLDTLIDQVARQPDAGGRAGATAPGRRTAGGAGGTNQWPRADLGAGSARQHLSPSAQGLSGDGRTFSLHSASVNVQYQLDLSGGNRQALQALAARTDYRRYQLAGAASTWPHASPARPSPRPALQPRPKPWRRSPTTRRRKLPLAQERLRLGQAMLPDVQAPQAALEQTRASALLLRKQAQQNAHLLAVLAGRAPGAGPLPAFSLEDFTLPAELPRVLPSELVRQRPDIQAAEALVRVASAEHGVAVARPYPASSAQRQPGQPGADHGRPVWWRLGR